MKNPIRFVVTVVITVVTAVVLGPAAAGVFGYAAGTTGAAVITGAVGGMAGGMASAAMYGGNVWKSMLIGAVGGAVGGWGVDYFGGISTAKGVIGGAVTGGATAGAVSTAFYGGNFMQNVLSAGITSGIFAAGYASARDYYRRIVRFEPDPLPGGEHVRKDESGTPVAGTNNVGFVNCQGILCEGQLISRIMNKIPILNATAGLHDSWFLGISDIRFTFFNWPTMPPAFAISTFSTLHGPVPGDLTRWLSRNND